MPGVDCMGRPGRPSDLVCLARASSGHGGVDGSRAEIVLRVTGALDPEPLLILPTSCDATVGEVKQAVERVRGIPVVEQRLLLGSRRLCADAPPVEGADGSAVVRGNRRQLGEALGPDCSRPGSFADVVLVRVTPEWAELLEDLREGLVSLSTLDDTARSDRELVVAAVSCEGGALAHASEGMRGDRRVVLAAVQRDPLALKFAAHELRDDHEVVLAACKLVGHALQYASDALRGDRGVVLAAITNSWRALAFASAGLRQDRDFMLAAVCVHGSALLFASPEIKDDHEVVLTAVKRSGWALSCASDRLRHDRECVEAAVISNPAALDFATESLQADPMLTYLASWASGRRGTSSPCSVGGAPQCALM